MGLSIGISVQRDTMADELELHVNYPLVYTNAILTKRGGQWKIVERSNRNNSASTPRLDQAFNSAMASLADQIKGMRFTPVKNSKNSPVNGCTITICKTEVSDDYGIMATITHELMEAYNPSDTTVAMIGKDITDRAKRLRQRIQGSFAPAAASA